MSPSKFLSCLCLLPDSPKKPGETLPPNIEEIRTEAELHSDVTIRQLYDKKCYRWLFRGFHTKIWMGFQLLPKDSRNLTTMIDYKISRKSVHFFLLPPSVAPPPISGFLKSHPGWDSLPFHFFQSHQGRMAS